MSKQQGFTLIELVMVIVILGILSAFALPRFANLGTEARAATMQGVLGSVRSASAISYSACLVSSGCSESAATGQSVTLEGQPIALAYGYPTTASILTAAQIASADFEIATAGTIAAKNASGTCEVTYAAPTAVNTSPAIAIDVSGC
ncbi:type II secretion system protein [Hydrocarboniclastica marina]|uniref:Type II secretion system protein n=1 Tax=Hydrocarboniclastica marina TaxID=2259620 RepID=A0A4P7XEF5_9ALTE|nr:type II secretion system protein [Hydrocarboniclastica marina]MAL99597.1 type II secretory pathway pseudopilin PulG [Alteromonadaceae bacterium]QCF24995.1 type II secretion system protein [Hydrocarboniclastica marina]|tara:strand:- start:14 stop:454 length:441 start_codon:yes stop_codon:yes gene_type:complete